MAEPGVTKDIVRRAYPGNGELVYLDTASYGLPPQPAVEALTAALEPWRTGEQAWEEWEGKADASRLLFAQLLNVQPEEIALLPSVAAATATVLTSLEPGAEVVICGDDHASVTLPTLSAARRRGFTVRLAPFEDITSAITPRTELVAVSHVHYGTGAVADVEALRAAAPNARIYIDATQSVGARAVTPAAWGVDCLSCSAYKWLCGARGTAFLYVAARHTEALDPIAPSRRATARPSESFAVEGLELSPTASRFDGSLAWLAWVLTYHALEVVSELAAKMHTGHTLARMLADALAIPWSGSSIVSVPVGDPRSVQRGLLDAGIKVSARAGAIRVSPHVYNTERDIGAAAGALVSYL